MLFFSFIIKLFLSVSESLIPLYKISVVLKYLTVFKIPFSPLSREWLDAKDTVLKPTARMAST